MTDDEVKKMKVAKVKVKKSLLFSTRYFFKKTNHRKFVVGDHHKLISNKLEEVLRGECTRLIINIAPRYGKTELAVKQFVAHCLANTPTAKFIHLSYSDTLALDNSKEIKDIVQSDDYRQMFPEVSIRKDSNSKKQWTTTRGGGVYATSSSGQVTGFGAGKVEEEENDDKNISSILDDIEQKEGFGGAIIIDDPIKPDDADSSTIRDRINNKFDSTIRNRVNSRKTPIIIIMQRLHEEDLCGHLIETEGDDWEVLSLPCIYNENEEEKALWEFKHTLEELKKLRQINTVVFDRQYMQDPQPLEGILFHPSNLNFFKNENIEDAELVVEYADTADEGDDNYSQPVGKIKGGKVYITDVIFSQKNLTVLEPLVLDALKKNKTHSLFIESNNAGASFIRNLREKTNVPISGVKNTAPKLSRILAESGFIEKYFYFLDPSLQSPEYQKFYKQIIRYLKNGGNNQKDDAPDSLAGLSFIIRRNYDGLVGNQNKE